MTSPLRLCDSYRSIGPRERSMLKKFKDLTEKEILAIAIGAEEEDGRIYGEFADALRDEYPSTAQMFEEIREEEAVHRDRLIEMFRQRFGEHIPLIRRENVKGFLQRRPVWLVRPLGVKVARKQAELMELEAQRFYHKAASRTADASTRELPRRKVQKPFWWDLRLRSGPASRWLSQRGSPTTDR